MPSAAAAALQPRKSKLVLDVPSTSFEEAFARMAWKVEPGQFALIGFREAPLPADLACLGRTPAQLIREEDESTLLVHEELAAAILERHPSAKIERDLAWIRFESPMSWDVVGFLAHVTGELARANVPIGAVCSFSRDHVFVARKHLIAVRDVLSRSFPEHA